MSLILTKEFRITLPETLDAQQYKVSALIRLITNDVWKLYEKFIPFDELSLILNNPLEENELINQGVRFCVMMTTDENVEFHDAFASDSLYYVSDIIVDAIPDEPVVEDQPLE